jgi:hypothetical protein
MGLREASPLRPPPCPLELRAATGLARSPSGASLSNEMALTMEAWRLTGRCGGGSRGALHALADCLSGFCHARLRASCFDILLLRELFSSAGCPYPS